MGEVGGLVGRKVASGSTIVKLVGLFLLFIGCTKGKTSGKQRLILGPTRESL